MATYARRVIFKPYRSGPSFTLTVWDLYMPRHGKLRLGYRLASRGSVLFEGTDFEAGWGCTADSDEVVRGIMGFLCLRPGDTDAEYFQHYTEEQLNFCNEHAEALGMEVEARFGDYY